MFGALRDCAPQLISAKHVEDQSAMMDTFKKDIMDLLKEVLSFVFVFLRLSLDSWK